MTKGMKGAVGTSASYIKLFGEKKALMMEQEVLGEFDLQPFLVTNQTTPRKMEYWVAMLLASIAQSLSKFAFDVRIMQSAGVGEWQEPFGNKQVGSSAMPFKKNPIKSEQICSLARLIINFSRLSLENASLSLLERTLDDSANRRIYIPEMFVTLDEVMKSASKIIDGLIINEKVVNKNLTTYAVFSATEEIILVAVKKGANRQEIHEVLRRLSLEAWEKVQSGQMNPLVNLLQENKTIKKYISKVELSRILEVKNHLGNAPQRATLLAKKIRSTIHEK